MSPTAIQISAFVLAFVIGLVYIMILARNSKSNRLFRNTLLICTAVIFLVHFLSDIHVIRQISEGEPNSFSLFILSILHSLELFIFQTHFFDNGYQDFFFGSGCQSGHPWFTYLFATTFLLAVITSVSFVIRTLNRKRAGRSWLSAHKKQSENVHIFFQGGKIATTLAEDIKNCHPEQPRVYIGFPDPEESFMDLSVWEKILRLFKSQAEEDLGPFNTIVYSRIPLGEADGKDICRQLNLKDLKDYLDKPSSKVYLLSDDEEYNLRCAEILYKDDCAAEIFCRACREGLNRMYEETMTRTPSISVHLVDSSYLAVRNIKTRPELLPVNYVEKGTDSEGRREGWVSTPFNAMILGFGETGREVLGFLYEQGAFVDKNFKKSPFSCVVMDHQKSNLEQRKNFPGMNEANGVTYTQCEIGSKEFWNDVSGRIHDLNYIVVCMGNDRLNLKMAVELVEFAFRNDKDLSKNFVILIAQENPSHLDDATLHHYNAIEQYHNCIRTFGSQKNVWTYDNMTNESLKARAKTYFEGYQRASGENGNWEEREKVIEATDNFATYAKRVRQRTQDYANCFHVATKLALIGPEIYEHRREIAQCIPTSYEENSTHYTGTDTHVEKTLHYLAVHEHIRWEASHVALGYTPGQRTDDLKKTHECIMSYDDLTPKMKHYDYLVIKTTFEIS